MHARHQRHKCMQVGPVSWGKYNWLLLGLDFIMPPTYYIWSIQDLFVLVDVTSTELMMWADGDCRPVCICTSFTNCFSIALELSLSSFTPTLLFPAPLSPLSWFLHVPKAPGFPLMAPSLSCVKWKNMALLVCDVCPLFSSLERQ